MSNEVPRTNEVWGYEGYGLEGNEGKYVFAVVFCIDGGKMRVMALDSGLPPDEIRDKVFDKCLRAVEQTWLATVPDCMGGKVHLDPWVGSGILKRESVEMAS